MNITRHGLPIFYCAVIALVSTTLAATSAARTAHAAELQPTDALPVVAVRLDAQGVATFEPTGRRLGQTGEPDLPWHTVTVLLPPNARLDTVRATVRDAAYETIDADALVTPIPPEATYVDGELIIDQPTDRPIMDGRDVSIYATDAHWPAESARVLATGELRGWQVADIAVPLARYNPVRQRLQRLIGGTLVITYDTVDVDGPGNHRADDRIARGRLAQLTANFDQVVETYAAGPEPEADSDNGDDKPGYVIFITSDLLAQLTELDAFIAMKEARGFDVQIVTDTDLGGATGNAAAENIRTWLQAHYLSDNIEYVLIIADPHPTTSTLPMKMLWPRSSSSDKREAPSDYYYADLTGNWDLDGDGLFGERYDDWGTGGIDRHAEVLVGRLPHVNTPADLDAALAKWVRLDKTPTPDAAWRRDVLLPMEPSDDSTPGYHLGEQIIDDILTPAGWGYHRVYDEDYGLTPPPETYPCDKPNVSAAWQALRPGLVIWWTHGSYYNATDIMDVLWASKTDANYPVFTFQVSCNNSEPEQINLTAILLAYGGWSGIGATRVSWYYVGQTHFSNSPSNSGMSYAYARKIVTYNRTCGEALHEIKEELYPSSPSMWMNFCVFNIYGDPSSSVGPKRFALTVGVENDPLGSVVLTPPADDANLAVYEAGQIVTLGAQPTENGLFEAWAICDPNFPGDLNHAVYDSNDSLTLVMDRDREIRTVFRCAQGVYGGMMPLAVGLVGLIGWRRARRRGMP